MRRFLIIFLTTLCLTASASYADWWPGEDFKMHFPQTPKPGGWDVEFASSRLADDWLCTESGPVTDIHFWISWLYDEVLPIDDIRIGIWSNNPSGPMGWSVPDVLLWERIFSPDDYIVQEWEPDLQGWFDPSSGGYEPENHIRRFQINIEEIPEPFFQEEDVIYWLEIDFGPLPYIGWKESDDHFNDDAVFWYSPYWWELRDPMTQESIDLAFVITGLCCDHDGIRGDVNYDFAGPNIVDLTYLVSWLFGSPPGPDPPCFEEADVNDDGTINIVDLTYLVAYLFGSGPRPLPCP